MQKRITPPVPIKKEFRDQMQFHWENGSRDEAFAVFVMESCPKAYAGYLRQIPGLSSRLESMGSISEFQALLTELIRSTPKK